ncbi:MAG: serine protease [Gammaproteobacteria bacterium]|nr:serine protease [Gammaproteobacteria bacterium]
MFYSSVIHIFSTTQEFDYANPWQSHTPSSSTGSGVVIGPGKILTGAHVVANATFIQVQKVSEPNKFIAQVAAICHDSDLALLEVKEPHFMDGIKIEEIGELPSLQDRVSVVGYPIGGREISITEGVVSRIERQQYRHSRRRLLAVTVDAAINDGNSGGPVFKEGKVIGIAFQTLKKAQNIGELVPANLIHRFLKGIENSCIINIPDIGVKTQNMENPLLRLQKHLKPQESGILIIAVQYGGSAWKHLSCGDVLLEIDGYQVANNGTVLYRNRYRTAYSVIMGDHFVGDEIELKILRRGERVSLRLLLKEKRSLVPFWNYDKVPSYFVYCGLVFQKLCLDYIATWEKWWDKAPSEFLYLYQSGICTRECQEVVILTQVLSDEINVGYQHLYDEAIISVNDKKPKDMLEFVRMVKNTSGILTVRTSRNGVIVFDTNDLLKENERISKRYHINSNHSSDLK